MVPSSNKREKLGAPFHIQVHFLTNPYSLHKFFSVWRQEQKTEKFDVLWSQFFPQKTNIYVRSNETWGQFTVNPDWESRLKTEFQMTLMQ